MKHSTQLIRSLLGLTVLLASCQVETHLVSYLTVKLNYSYQRRVIIMSKLSLKLQKKVN